MKSLTKILLVGLLLIGITNTTKACEIEFEVDGTKKELYSVGDEIVVKVKISFTHRVCSLGIKETKFNSKGIKIIGATDWKEISPGVWERKLKAKVTGSKNGKLSITGERTCNLTGGFGSIAFTSESI